jgi:hypothetical protein
MQIMTRAETQLLTQRVRASMVPPTFEFSIRSVEKMSVGFYSSEHSQRIPGSGAMEPRAGNRARKDRNHDT